MSVLIRILQIVAALVLLAVAVLWFAARRGDRGTIEEEVTIARPAPAVFRWISSEDLARRWISGVVELRIDNAGTSPTGERSFKMTQWIAAHRVEMTLRVARVVPNQELHLLVSSGDSNEGFSGDASFKLISGDDYTRLA